MAVAPLRRRAGKTDIDNRQRKTREELKKRQEKEKKAEITPEDHEERMEKLRELGLIK